MLCDFECDGACHVWQAILDDAQHWWFRGRIRKDLLDLSDAFFKAHYIISEHFLPLLSEKLRVSALESLDSFLGFAGSRQRKHHWLCLQHIMSMQKLENSYFLGPIAKELGNVFTAFSLIPTFAIFMNPIKDIRSPLCFRCEVLSVLSAVSFLHWRASIGWEEKIAVSSIVKRRLSVSRVSNW